VRRGVRRGEAVDEVGIAGRDGEVGDAREDEEDDAGGGASLEFFLVIIFGEKAKKSKFRKRVSFF